MRVRTAVLIAVAGVLAAAAAPEAQQFVLSSQDRAKLIAVDFSAISPDGSPVADLRADEVALRIGGRARTIRALEYVPLRTGHGTAASLPYGTNMATGNGRAVVLLVDLETIRPGREAGLREHVGRMVRALGPSDRIALVTVPYGGVKVDLTSDHTAVSRMLATISGQAPPTESASEAACRTRTTLVALRGALDDLRGGEAPVTIVVFSGQMSSPQSVLPMTTGSSLGRCQLLREHFQQVGAAAAGARAQVYLVQPELSQTSEGRAGLEHLTGVTGAPLWDLGISDGALSRIVRETGGYYLARVEPDPDEESGAMRGLDLTVSRPGVTLRARPQVAVIRASPPAVVAAPARPLDMMKDLKVHRDLPLRVVAFSSREPGDDRLRVTVLFDSPDRTAVPSEAMVGLFATDGRLVSSRVLTAAELDEPTVITALAAPQGTYRLRVAAVEASGRSGTADFPVDAGLIAAGGLRLSDLVVGLSRNGLFQPKLEFAQEASLMAQLEVYGGREGSRVGVVFEIARTMNGPALLAVPGAFTATAEPDKFLASAAVPIGALPAGDYVVRATVAAEGQAGGRVVRPVRKVAR
jgi:hypothetical protein